MRFDTIIMTARRSGTADDGTRITAGQPMAWCRRTRRVLTACPVRIDEIERQQAADAHDMRWEDDCAARCGL